MKFLQNIALAFAALSAGVILSTAGSAFDEEKRRLIASLSLAALPPLAPDPTNVAVGNPTAMALGATLFFDMRLSKNGAVACSTCHQIGRQFQDGLPLGKGIGTMNRRTQPLTGVAWQRWFFWDGRKDSLWSQALAPLEKAEEHGASRSGIAHFIASNFRDRYERVFGSMPDLSRVPENGGPLGTAAERAAWRGMRAADRHAVNEVFANVGKMIAAFERTLVHEQTRFDRFADALSGGGQAGEGSGLDAQELEGLQLFVGKGNCVTCHNGPRFTDGAFHNTGVPPAPGLSDDRGRERGIGDLAADEFRCGGSVDGADAAGCPSPLSGLTRKRDLVRAYKTPSLRGVALRPPYMHAGQFATLDAILDHYSTAPASIAGRTELKPLQLTGAEKQALIAFLRTLGNEGT